MCNGGAPATAAPVATDNSLWRFADDRRIGKMYKLGKAVQGGLCAGYRFGRGGVPVTLDAQGATTRG